MQEGFSARLKNAMAAKGFKQSDLIREAAVRGAKLGKSQVSHCLLYTSDAADD